MSIIEVLLFVLLGVLLGAFAGLIPGVHPNLFATLFLTYTFSEPFGAAVILVSAAVANAIVAFVPSVFLGAPDSGTELSVLPGHKLLLEGRGYEAVFLTSLGGLSAMALVLLTLPVAAFVLPAFYVFLRPHLHWLLSLVLIYALWKDRSVWAVVVVTLSGLLGLLALNAFKDPLFPMLSGLFGMSGLLYSLRTAQVIRPQVISSIQAPSRECIGGSSIGYLAGMLVGLLPGIGASMAAFLVQELCGDKNTRRFLVALGGIATADAIFSLLALWLIGNPRSGVAVSVEQLLGKLTSGDVIVFFGAMCLAAALASLAALKLAGLFACGVARVDYKRLTTTVVAGLGLAVLVLSGLDGLLLMSLATAIGMVAVLSGTRRSYLMACLLVPTILFFAGV